VNKLLPLIVNNVSLSVDNRALLHNLNFKIDVCDISVVLGHNGAGKSLLLRLLHGLMAPSDGSIAWAGKDSMQISTRQQQAMVFQKPVLLKRSVVANMNYVLKLRGKPNSLGQNLLRSANLHDKQSQPAQSLSGGEQQRLAIARALALEPHVLLMDEPSANLDPSATQKIELQIEQARQSGIKIILVTHDVAQAKRLADEVLFLQQGQLAEQTTAAQFFNQPRSDAAQQYLSAYRA